MIAMQKISPSSLEVGKFFSEKWWDDLPDVFQDLSEKIKDRRYVVKCKPHQVNRAVLACEYVTETAPKGGRVLDMACGVGFNGVYLATQGYRVEGFDLSDKAIVRANELSQSLGHSPEMFVVADESYIFDLPDESFDAVLAMGFFRYLDSESQEACYRHVHRILKPKGKFVITHQNMLFEMFALNDGTLRFWADLIEGYAEVSGLLGGKSVHEALKEAITVPGRKYASHSISRHMPVQSENPLSYGEVATSKGFRLEKMSFPSSHLLPPWLESQVDQEKLSDLKRKVCLERAEAEDWRAMFMEYEFLAFLERA